jgi:hypothetical protein
MGDHLAVGFKNFGVGPTFLNLNLYATFDIYFYLFLNFGLQLGELALEHVHRLLVQ